MSRFLFNFVKSKIPKISDTELIALRSGNTSIDRDILSGRLVFPRPPKIENKFSDKKLEKLLTEYDNTPIYHNNNNNKWINYLGKNKFFSFLIDEKYNGIKLSNNELSNMRR